MGDIPPLPGAGDRWALFLDVDGTLVAIAPTPETVRADPTLLALLERLRGASGGALALISGRSLASIDRVFRPLTLPAAGVHGWERRRADGAAMPINVSTEALLPLRQVLESYAATHPGLLFEDKGDSVALHYRLAPRYGAAVCRLARGLAAQYPELRLIEGRKVVEFVPRGTDKGRAVSAFVAEPPFAGRYPVYVGDDVTDEDAFIAVNQLGGLSIKVDDPEQRVRSTAAQFRLPSVSAMHDWLAAVAARLDGDHAAEPTGGTATARAAFS